MQADLERLPYWREASGIVREACRVPAEIAILSPVLTFFALILGLLMQLGATPSMLGPFRRMLGKLVLDAKGNVIGMAGVIVSGTAETTDKLRDANPPAEPAIATPVVPARPTQGQPFHREPSRPRVTAPRAAWSARVAAAARDGPPHHSRRPPPSPQPSTLARKKTGTPAVKVCPKRYDIRTTGRGPTAHVPL
jgi:hypothetical protein